MKNYKQKEILSLIEEANQDNALNILKAIKDKIEDNRQSFETTSVCRDDVFFALTGSWSYDKEENEEVQQLVNSIDDSDMETLATELGERDMESYWLIIKNWAKALTNKGEIK